MTPESELPLVADDQVEPAVVVVAPPTAGEAGHRFDDAERGGDVGGVAGAVVAGGPVRLAVVGDVEVGVAVVVDVAPGRSLPQRLLSTPASRATSVNLPEPSLW